MLTVQRSPLKDKDGREQTDMFGVIYTWCVLLIHKDEWKPFRYNHNFGIKPLFRE
ncbi:hypothetical protein ABVC73_12905 [Prevotella melaninogenica]